MLAGYPKKVNPQKLISESNDIFTFEGNGQFFDRLREEEAKKVQSLLDIQARGRSARQQEQEDETAAKVRLTERPKSVASRMSRDSA